MTELLTKLFIKNHNEIKHPRVRQSYGKMVGIVGIVANLLLCAVKFILGFLCEF